MFISHAQNLEDVVLWRALGDVERGTYVDVGAFDPVVDSVTWAFYRRGWRGALVEAVPSLSEALRTQRPEDTVIEAAAGAERGSARLYAVASTGSSTLVDSYGAEIVASGAVVEELVVPVAPLDDLLAEAGFGGRTIHFCTIDVEGSEAEVLAGFDLQRWRPWVLVVEATRPNTAEPAHEEWEPRILHSGYRFCLFDGLNRFYVDQLHAGRLAPLLAYPACALDQPFERADQAELRNGFERASQHLEWLEDTHSYVRGRLSTIENTLSWRVTRPIRAVRRLQLARSRAMTPAPPEQSEADLEKLRTAFAGRLVAAASLLDPELTVEPNGLEGALSAFGESLRRSRAPDRARAWLSLVTVYGAYPLEEDIDATARRLRMEGPRAVTEELSSGFRRALAQGSASTAGLRVVRDAVVVDVSNTVSTEIWTGIQRVVRETALRWLTARPEPTFVAFDLRNGFVRPLTQLESAVIASTSGGSAQSHVALGEGRDQPAVVVPWECRLVVPELFVERGRCDAYRGLVTSGVLHSFSMIGYDLVPLVASETAADGMPAAFVDYLSVVKHADRISTISRSTADGYAAFGVMTEAEGARPPVVVAHPLPTTEAPQLTADGIEAARKRLGVGTLPLILVVGSHEPRKNHLRVLEAAERLWATASRFQLLFVGGSSWRSDDFERLAAHLASLGRPVGIVRRASEEDLWAAYRLARFSVFPSLAEGFGLPVAESLVSGTPVITSRHGSLAEIAEGGGCLMVDPYDLTTIEDAMRNLLHDDGLLEGLRAQARDRHMSTWAEYADAVWSFLVGGHSQ